jgi:hypothetical protein
MMICIATSPRFASAADFVCAKPDRALNKWSPGPYSSDCVNHGPGPKPATSCADCDELICQWSCSDGTLGNVDPLVVIRCSCGLI